MFPEYNEGNGKRQKPKALAVILDHVKDENGDGAANIDDVEALPQAEQGRPDSPESRRQIPRRRLPQPRVHRAPERGGHRRHQPALLPLPRVRRPARGAREEVPDHRERQNAITYKEIFPLIKDNKLWLGVTIHSGDREFRVPDHYPLNAAGWRVDENGVKYIRVKGVRWYTNLDHGRRHQKLPLMTMADNLRFSKHKEIKGKAAYDRYDNYDAIEVPFTDAIPSDYDGVMGVPITFLDKYNPDQFEIVGNSDDGDMMTETRVVHSVKEFIRRISRPSAGTGHYSPGMRMLGLLERQPQVIYKRILIRHRRTRPARGTKK